MKMNRTRFNYLRQEREGDGLQQMPLVFGSMRKTTTTTATTRTSYNRTEPALRGPAVIAGNRPKRMANGNNLNRTSGNAAGASPEAAGNRRLASARGHFLPRVAKLASNNNSSNNNSNSNNINNNNNNNKYNNNNNGSYISSNAVKPPMMRNKSPFNIRRGGGSNLEKSSSPAKATQLHPMEQQQQQQQQQKHRQPLENPMNRIHGMSGLGMGAISPTHNAPTFSSSSSCLSNSSNLELQHLKLTNALGLPEEQNKSFVYLCKPVKRMKELLMVRPLRNSYDQVEDPLMLPETNDSDSFSCCSSGCRQLDLVADQEQLLAEQMKLEREERELELQLEQKHQPVQKPDREPESEPEPVPVPEPEPEPERVTEQSDWNPLEQIHGFQYKLEQQLQATAGWQEHKWHLELKQKGRGTLSEPSPELERDFGLELELQEEQRRVHQKHLEMEHICPSIPTLQREIKLLQQLGKKLEATLHSDAGNEPETGQRLDSAHSSNSSSSVFYTPRSMMAIYSCDPLPIVRLGYRWVEQLPDRMQRARVTQHALSIGCIREFRIEMKTLTELKTADESQCFYMPLGEGGDLQPTSFRMLRENPNVLLQQLRPVSPARPFNLLEQDPMFFNSMLNYGEPQLGALSRGAFQLQQPRESGGGAEAGVQLPFSFAPFSRLSVGSPGLKESAKVWAGVGGGELELERQVLPTVNATVQCEINKPSSSSSLSSSSTTKLPSLRNADLCRWKRPKPSPLRPPRLRLVTPLNANGPQLEPRVHSQLLKTVLVGIVQVAIFLILIMAFTYPDVRC